MNFVYIVYNYFHWASYLIHAVEVIESKVNLFFKFNSNNFILEVVSTWKDVILTGFLGFNLTGKRCYDVSWWSSVKYYQSVGNGVAGTIKKLYLGILKKAENRA